MSAEGWLCVIFRKPTRHGQDNQRAAAGAEKEEIHVTPLLF